MKTSFFKKIYQWFVHKLNELTGDEEDDDSEVLVKKPKEYLINVSLGDFTFSVKVTEDNEEEYRKTVKRLNDELTKYRSRYPNMTTEHLYAFIALKEALKKDKE